MRLLDLSPDWLVYEGRRVAMIFRCPHCLDDKERWWLTCFFEASGTLPQWFGEDAKEDEIVNLCRADQQWARTSDDFASMSITPSIDASHSGHWHGFITNGAVV